MNLEDVLKCDGLCDINSLDLFSELKVLREVLQRENNSPIETLDYIKKGRFFFKCINCKHNITNHSSYCCFCREEFFKVETNKVLFKINDVARATDWVSYVVY